MGTYPNIDKLKLLVPNPEDLKAKHITDEVAREIMMMQMDEILDRYRPLIFEQIKRSRELL